MQAGGNAAPTAGKGKPVGVVRMPDTAGPMRPFNLRVDPEERLSSKPPQQGQGDVRNRDRRDRAARLGAGPLSRYLLVLALLAVAAAVAYVGTRRDDNISVAVLVPKVDMPAFHALTMADLTVETRKTRRGERFATVPVDGRLTMRAVRKGQPLVPDDVSPDIAAALGRKPIVTGVKVSHAGAFAGGLQAGQRIDLVLVRGRQRIAELNAIVLATKPVGESSEDWTLIVGIREADAKAHKVDLATTEVSVFRDPAGLDAPR